MNELIPTTLTSEVLKEKARSLGADLVGIADGALMDHLADWAPDAAVRKKILVDNAEKLFGF